MDRDEDRRREEEVVRWVGVSTAENGRVTLTLTLTLSCELYLSKNPIFFLLRQYLHLTISSVPALFTLYPLTSPSS